MKSNARRTKCKQPINLDFLYNLQTKNNSIFIRLRLIPPLINILLLYILFSTGKFQNLILWRTLKLLSVRYKVSKKVQLSNVVYDSMYYNAEWVI